MDQAIEEGKIKIKEPKEEFIHELNDIISKSGDDLRLSHADKKLLALALDLLNEYDANIKVLTDDYSMQNVLKILDIPYDCLLGVMRLIYYSLITASSCPQQSGTSALRGMQGYMFLHMYIDRYLKYFIGFSKIF